MTPKPSLPAITPGSGIAVSTRKPVAKKVAAKKSPILKKTVVSVKPPKSPRKRKAAGSSGVQLVERVTRAIERELTQIEIIVSGERVTPTRRTEAERRARLLASLARTLAEVTRLRAAQADSRNEDDDDAMPRDLDEFRAALERRLAQLVAGAEDQAARGDEPD